MLSSVEVINRQGSLLALPLEESSNGLLVTSIEGLEPVKATLVSSSFANIDGGQYHSSRREPRNIKVRLELEPDFVTDTVRSLRNKLYDFFMPKTEVTLRFRAINELDPNIVTQNLTVEIVGRIESFETPLFTKDPAVDISFVCYDPDFIDPELVAVNGLSTAGLDESFIIYDGSVETGVTFSFFADRAVDSFTIYHRPPDGTLRILEFTQPLLSGDVLKINTSVGSKSVTRIRAGVESSLVYGMTPQSNWIELQPGSNSIRVYAVGAAVGYLFEYYTKHGGL